MDYAGNDSGNRYYPDYYQEFNFKSFRIYFSGNYYVKKKKNAEKYHQILSPGFCYEISSVSEIRFDRYKDEIIKHYYLRQYK